MCDGYERSLHRDDLGRRNFLNATGAATAIGNVSRDLFTDPVHADALIQAQRDSMTINKFIEAMKKNESCLASVRKSSNYFNKRRARATEHFPEAALLKPTFSRTPAEVNMHLGVKGHTCSYNLCDVIAGGLGRGDR